MQLVERLHRFGHELVDLCPGDDQGRRGDQGVPHRPHDETVLHGKVTGPGPDRATLREERPRGLTGDQFEGAKETEATRFPDQRVGAEFAPTGRPIRRELITDAIDDPLTLEDIKVREGDRARHRMPGIGVAVEELATLAHQDLRHPVGDHERAERLVTRGDGLGEGHEVRARAKVLAAEPATGATEPADDLIRGEQDAVAVDDALDLGPIGARRDDHPAGALHRFGDEGRDLVRADLEDLGLEFTRRLQTELVGIEVSAAFEPVWLADVHDAGDGQAALRVHRLHAAERGTGYGAAVVAVPTADDHLTLRLTAQRPVTPHHAHQGVVGLAAGAREERMVELRRRQTGEPRRQLDRRRIGALEEAVVVRQFEHLSMGRLGEFAAPVAEGDAPQTGHPIEDAMAFGVMQPYPLGAGDHARTARGKRPMVGERMQVVRRVERLPCDRIVGVGHTATLRHSAAGAHAPRN